VSRASSRQYDALVKHPEDKISSELHRARSLTRDIMKISMKVGGYQKFDDYIYDLDVTPKLTQI